MYVLSGDNMRRSFRAYVDEFRSQRVYDIDRDIDTRADTDGRPTLSTVNVACRRHLTGHQDNSTTDTE